MRIVKTDLEGNFWHVRFRPAWLFTRTRSPDFANEAAGSIAKGARVKRGRTGSGKWLVTTVLIPKAPGRDRRTAEALARRVLAELEG